VSVLANWDVRYSRYLGIYGPQLRDAKYSGYSGYLGIYGPQLRNARYSGYLGIYGLELRGCLILWVLGDIWAAAQGCQGGT
jgi:hypothetical protein